MRDSGKRLKILTRSEIQEIYELPIFTGEERMIYFHLDPLEQQELEAFRSSHIKVYFILQLGYFKAKKMFFILKFEEVKEDIRCILKQYFIETNEFTDIKISKPARLAQQDRILNLLSYKICTQKIKQELQEKANYLVTIHIRPIYVFKELLNYLENRQIVIPGYSIMQNIVGKALIYEKKRLEIAIKQYIPELARSRLDKLLAAEEGLYELTFFKKEPKDFSHKEITKEVDKRQSLKEFYDLAQVFFPKTGISNENIKYYAALVSYYSVYKLNRMKQETAYVYLLCFIFNRYQKINDNLVNTFRYYVNKYISEAKQAAKEEVYQYKIEGDKHLPSAGKILELFIDETIPENIDFHNVKERAFTILDRNKFSFLVKYITQIEVDEIRFEWEQYVKLSHQFKLNLRYIFLNLDFESQKKDTPLITAVTFLKDAFRKNIILRQQESDNFPQEFIQSKFHRYLYDSKKIQTPKGMRTLRTLNADKYEFLVYRLLCKGLESGEFFIQDSINFRSFEADLICDEQWQNKDQLIKSLNFPYLHLPIDKILALLKEILEFRMIVVNQRIKEGKNTHIKLKKKGDNITWTLPYPQKEETVNHPIYQKVRQIGVGDLLHFVDQHCNFIDSFDHILDKYVKRQVDNRKIFACVVAYGTNIGLFKMAKISDISLQELTSTAHSFIRLETLKAANDKISNATAKLPIFKYFNIEEDIIHSSSDGQKFGTQFDTINSRYSPKYFGLNKGIVDYTMLANHVPVNAKIIGANDHESYYVYDIIYNNTSNIIPDTHSTDMHGRNAVNFALLHMSGQMFAPRYTDFNSKLQSLYAFETPKHYEGYPIKPVRKINTKLIEEEWPNIQKIMVSLALKTTTQSTIIRKLSSYLRRNKTRLALWEFDHIIESIYMLNWIDIPELRQNVQKALNRVESYHKLKRAIFYANGGKFRVKTELEQQIWSQCTRLIANSIIFYNAFMLSHLLAEMERLKRHEEADLIKKISPVAWSHINLYGSYEFYKEKSSINIEEIVAVLINQKSVLNELTSAVAQEYDL